VTLTSTHLNPGEAVYESILVETLGRVTTVTMNRPERRNAVDGPMAAELAAAFRAFDADPESDAAVLFGAGGHFCAGADLKAVGTERGNQVRADGDGPMGPTRLRLGKPVIAAIEGYAVAGGLELAIWCDLRVAARDAVFGVFCRRWGVPLIDGGTVRLPRLIGQSHALDLILTGRGVEGDEALRMGLANRLTEPGAALATAVSLAHDLAQLPQTCMRNDRQSAYEQWDLPFDRAMANELVVGRDSMRAPDQTVGRFVAGEGRHGRAPGGSGSATGV
jgi:enoyl-CoA hydratase